MNSLTKKWLFRQCVSSILVISLGLVGCNQAPEQPTNESVNQSTSEPTDKLTNNAQATNQSAEPAQSDKSAQDKTTVEQAITILALGDSLTEGLGLPAGDTYPAQLQQTLQSMGYANAKVINSGLSGETSTGMVNRLDWVLKTKPDIAIVTIGANDAMRGLPVANLENNLRTAIERLQAENITVVLGGMQIYDNLGSDYVAKFSAVYPKIAQEYDVALIPFFLQGVGGDATLNQSDSIHPTKAGYTKIVTQNIMPVLEPVLLAFVGEMGAGETTKKETSQ